MKKGLLSLLAVALTIVSCQNYDDQFAELTGLVETLSTEVEGLTKVQDDLTALSSTVGNLKASIDGLPNPTANIAAIASGLASATTQITAIETALADGVASAADLAAIDTLIDAVQADIDTLLSENAAISVPISIVSPLTLVNAQKFIKVGEGTPGGYLLNGNLTVDFYTASATLSAAEIETANELVAKIISVTGDVSVNGAVDLAGLTYINGDYTITGYEPNDTTVANVSGDLTVDGAILDANGVWGVLDLTHITSVGDNVVITNQVSVTSIDLSGITSGGSGIQTGAPANTVVFANATGDINLGPLEVLSITADKSLGAITSTQAGTVPSLAINADLAATITANNITAVTGALSVAGSTTTEVYLNKVATAGAITVTAKVNEFHIPALVSSVNEIDVLAGTVNASALRTMSDETDFNASGAVLLPTGGEIALTDNLTCVPASGIINIPNLIISGAGVVASTTATDVTIGSYNTDATLANFNPTVVTNLTLVAQEITLGTLDASLATLVALTVTGSGTTGAAPITITPASQANLTSLHVADMEGVVLVSTSLVTLTTSGYVRSVDVSGANAVLRSVNVGHTYALQPIFTSGMEFKLDTGGAANTLKSLDLSALTRLAVADIDNNVALATITAPVFVDATSALQAGAGFAGSANHDYVIGENALRATWTGRIAAVSNGSTNTPAVSAKLTQPSLKGWADYIVSQWGVDSDGAAGTVNSPTFSLDFATSSGGAGATNWDSIVATVASTTLDSAAVAAQNEFIDKSSNASARPNNLIIR